MGRHGDEDDAKPESVAEAVTEMKIENEDSVSDGSAPKTPRDESVVNGSVTPSKPTAVFTTATKNTSTNHSSPNTTPPTNGTRASSPVVKSRSHSHSSSNDDDDEEEKKMGGEITVKLEPGQPPKLARTSSQKVVTRPPPLFNDLPDDTDAAKATFQLMEACTYANKYMGYTEHGMECDCAEEWDSVEGKNAACGDDSDCINRATKMECVGDCGCGDNCQNQRFQRQEYADVAVITTEKKGFGLRANTDLRPHQLIFEYIGEVIHENQFRRRMIQYDEEGIKHFYFMSLSKGEFVDATKKGNLGRFCNHSCNPNCYVDKWVVGEKLRMGIFAERHIKAGEELVFNYNVDRYGADPQPCYCGEPNCTGFIGGKTQTERATKLSNATIEALGIDDGDGWDTAVAKKPRKKKTGEDDEEYVDSVQPKSLSEDGVTKVMAALMQCKEKWIAVKLLGRIQRCEDERVRNRVVKMHGYQILNSQLGTWKDDFNVVLQILDILDGFPRLTRNKIIDSKIEETVQPLVECGNERVEKKAAELLKIWSTLEVGYRIPRLKRDPAANATQVNQFERRETRRDEQKSRAKSRSRSRSRSIDAPRGPAAQTRGGMGPRNRHHGHGHAHGQRPFRRPPPKNMLPPGWFATTDANGATYYYSSRGETTWTRPTMPAAEPPPPPPKPESKTKALQDIIDGIMNAKEATPKDKSATPATPQPAQSAPSEKKKKEEKWRSQSEEKQKRLYENTLFPHVKYVMDKFKHKLPKDDLKRYAKEVAKKLVSSDFKNKRVDDPTTITEKKQKQVKAYCKEYFDKAVVKHRAYEKKKAEKKAKLEKSKEETDKSVDTRVQAKKEDESDDDVKISDDEMENADGKKSSPLSAEDTESRKRKRDGDDGDDGPDSPSKKQKSASPPPPPPPPPRSTSPSADLKRKRDDYLDKDEEDGGASPMKRQRSETPPAPPPPPPPQTDTPEPQNQESNNSNDAEDPGRNRTHTREGLPTSKDDVNGFSSRRSSFQSNGSRPGSSRPSSSGSHKSHRGQRHNNNHHRDRRDRHDNSNNNSRRVSIEGRM